MSTQSSDPRDPYRPNRQPPEDGKGRRYNLLLIFGIIAFAIAAIYLIFLVATQADDIFFPGNEIKTGALSKLPGIDSGENPKSADINERITLLVLGLDRKLGASPGAERTDSIFVLSVDPFSKTAGVLSIPRDLVVAIPNNEGEFFQDRINVAYQYGETVLTDYPDGGPGLAMDTIEHNFGIPVDHYMVINFEAFVGLVDEIGGIDLDVPKYRASTNFSNCAGCPGHFVEFFPGVQHMDGETALTYARIRQGTDDLDRIDRQQLVMQAVADQVISLDLLLLNNLTSLYGKFKDSVETDIADWQIPGFALLAEDIGVDNLKTVSLRSAVQGGRLGEAAVLYADWTKVNQLKNQIFLDGAFQAESALIHIQNGTTDPGLTDRIFNFLTSRGVAPENIVITEVNNGILYQTTQIYDLNEKPRTSEMLATWLELTATQIVDSESPEAATIQPHGADVIIVLGADLTASEAAAPTTGN